MDEADIASDRAEAYLGDRLAAQRRRAALDQPGATLCADCGEPIPEDRRKALPSAIRCVGCQEFAEKVGRA